MKLDFMSFGLDKFAPDGNRNRAVLTYDDKTKIEVMQFLSPETLAAIEHDAMAAAANTLKIQLEV